ncbi:MULTISPECIES: exodeoxyribonuclease VII small subunit [unclassified Corynebacterium]|uniref:exodeoxyribonuclease VII small subunit n=1 Tax=unclassified Corynebacterium TaxID=2624378 RepID=UPI001EF64E1E|nr:MULTISPECIES: exodeoxyribonuclease VII small subunit [unclassified Corynebacterium]MCG7258531.1 exodeoxyribonuclease VII small subunit [Corynebacterium sp. ACRQK]MCG7262699.1 exodeoxyribonuclease VII small subunit [Corynebacterium sp. ACRQL]
MANNTSNGTNNTESGEQQKFRPLDQLSYEQARDELVEVVKILELGQMSLDESLNYWERGEELAAYCEDYLNGASKRIEQALQQREARNAEAQGES